MYAIDIVSDTAFKDINKTEVKLLIKSINNKYEIKKIVDCDDKLNQYQIIKYFIRVFIDRDEKDKVPPELLNEINDVVMREINKEP